MLFRSALFNSLASKQEMFVDGKKIYSAEKLKVGLFKDPSNF